MLAQTNQNNMTYDITYEECRRGKQKSSVALELQKFTFADSYKIYSDLFKEKVFFSFIHFSCAALTRVGRSNEGGKGAPAGQ